MLSEIDLAGSLVVIGSFLELVGDFLNYRTIVALKSIKFLSFDTTLTDCLDYFLCLIYTLTYLTPKIERQYELRNPIYPDVNLSAFMGILEFCKLGIALSVLLCLSRYQHTKIKDQSFSTTCKCLIGINLVVFGTIYYVIRKYNSKVLMLIDLVEYLWLAVQQIKIFKYWPQLLMNLGNSSSFHTIWLKFRLLGLLVGLIGKFVLIRAIEWFDIPLNIYTFPYYFVNIPIVIALIYQSKWHNPARYKLI